MVACRLSLVVAKSGREGNQTDGNLLVPEYYGWVCEHVQESRCFLWCSQQPPTLDSRSIATDRAHSSGHLAMDAPCGSALQVQLYPPPEEAWDLPDSGLIDLQQQKVQSPRGAITEVFL